MTATTVSASSRNILTALANGPKMSKDVATELNVKTVVVTGSLASLKKSGFVEVQSDGKLTLTASGIQLVAPVVVNPVAGVTVVSTIAHKGDKKNAARAIVASFPAGTARKDIMAAFKAQLGMSDAQASTYHYALCGQNGIWR